MSEETIDVKTDVPQTPKFTSDQRLAIRDAQYQSLKLRELSRQQLDQAITIDSQIAQFINKIASDMKVDPKLYAFDTDTVSFYPVPEKK